MLPNLKIKTRHGAIGRAATPAKSATDKKSPRRARAEGESGFYTSFTGVAAVVLFSKSTARWQFCLLV